jgi:hypothetical protein
LLGSPAETLRDRYKGCSNFSAKNSMRLKLTIQRAAVTHVDRISHNLGSLQPFVESTV